MGAREFVKRKGSLRYPARSRRHSLLVGHREPVCQKRRSVGWWQVKVLLLKSTCLRGIGDDFILVFNVRRRPMIRLAKEPHVPLFGRLPKVGAEALRLA